DCPRRQEEKPSGDADREPRMDASRRNEGGLPTTLPPGATGAHAAAIAIVIGIMLAMFLSALEQTIVAPALPSIGRALGDVAELPWVITAYLLSTTAATPMFGKLSDIYGRRLMML